MTVSVQTIVASVQSLVAGLKQVKEEIQQLQKMRIPQDRFVVVMQVSDTTAQICHCPQTHTFMQPFVVQMSSVVDSLKNMATSLDNELRSMLAFFGEIPDSPEAPKPEDFFGLILSFSSSLQKAALEVHDAMPKVELPSPKIAIEEPASPTEEEGVRSHSASAPCKKLIAPQTIKGKDGDTLRPPPSSQSRATGRSIGRGDLDQAIRSMRSGRRRERNPASRPLSKIFMDGSRQSRIFE